MACILRPTDVLHFLAECTVLRLRTFFCKYVW